MSGLEVAVAVIGITDVALRSIKGLYDFFQDLQDARESLPQIWSEVTYIQANLSSLDFLSKADEDTLKEVKATGITQGINDCGNVCEKFTRQLTRWTKDGVDGLGGKLKFKIHSAQIKKNGARLWATARMLDMSIGILTLKLVHKSEAERAVETSALKQAVDGWRLEAEQERERVSAEMKALDDTEDSGVIDELDEEESVLKKFVEQSGQTAEQLQAIKLNQTINHIKSNNRSEVKLGMPAAVVDKVAQQTITNVTSTNSKVTVGICNARGARKWAHGSSHLSLLCCSPTQRLFVATMALDRSQLVASASAKASFQVERSSQFVLFAACGRRGKVDSRSASLQMRRSGERAARPQPLLWGPLPSEQQKQHLPAWPGSVSQAGKRHRQQYYSSIGENPRTDEAHHLPGTPHRGSAYAAWGQIALNLTRLALKVSHKKMPEALEVNSEVLDNIYEEFKTIVQVVDDFSSKLDLPRTLETVESIDANHMQMVRYSSRDDQGYRAICGVLRTTIREGTDTARGGNGGGICEGGAVGDTADGCGTDTATERVITPTYYIPFSQNRYFVGRRDGLDMLKQKLMVSQECQKMTVVGLGGTGKTQVALQFVYTVKETWSEFSVFWVPALSVESFEQTCADIARELHVPRVAGGEEDVKELVRQHLSSARAGRWLLVVDNADDPDILFGTAESNDIVDYLVESEKGVTDVVVLLTRGDVLELQAMNPQDAADFLEKSLVRKDLLRDKAATKELPDELTCLPLAIAGFRDDTRNKSSANAVATTWVVSFGQIRAHDVVAADRFWHSCPGRADGEGHRQAENKQDSDVEESLNCDCGLGDV
ncbi:hypothetical protein GQ44DRAFT_817509 [Phaeosphaeriaceae sp. PMI808]|nr:hypothetical protein GQ44DRAFT_817509 [Phaeosphaeriaceae sp. PMI808]